MSGVSLAWIFVMISWLMLSTFWTSAVMPLALASATICFLRPSNTRGSTLIHTDTFLSSESPPPLPQAASVDVTASTAAATSEVRPRFEIRIIFSSES